MNTSNSNIVWVFGSSGSGKETFIRHITNNSSSKLVKRLGWEGKKIIPIWESISYIGQFRFHLVVRKRRTIIEKTIEALRPGNSVVLIKGQDVDFRMNLLNVLKEKFPHAKHQIIFLHTDLNTLFKRWKKKSWYKKKYTEETVKKWLVSQLDNLGKLEGFDIIALDSSDDQYREVKYPPNVD